MTSARTCNRDSSDSSDSNDANDSMEFYGTPRNLVRLSGWAVFVVKMQVFDLTNDLTSMLTSCQVNCQVTCQVKNAVKLKEKP